MPIIYYLIDKKNQSQPLFNDQKLCTQNIKAKVYNSTTNQLYDKGEHTIENQNWLF